MKRNRILATILLVAMVCTMSFGTALAGPKTASSATDVRVNGYLVEFPDEKPFVNSDNLSLIHI